VRNPQFAVWSADARPDGYADEIHLRLSDDVAAQVAAVGRGRADVMLGPPVERLKGLLTQYPGRLHSHAVPWTDYMFLNTRAPPFDDLRVRQALNHAVDRERMVDLLGGAPRRAARLPAPAAGRSGLPTLLPLHAQPEPCRDVDRSRSSSSSTAGRLGVT
jgi:ABC-type transport system substrate-binding protein